jgi:glutamate racemase
MRFALVDSGLGVLPAAMHLRRLCPGAELVLSMDPEGMPWGPRTAEDIAERALACAEATLPWEPDVLVLACNTASVRALDVLRTEFEPAVPVVGTVPAIKPAAAGGGPVAIWATAATTGSPYQRDLIRRFADGVQVTEVACPGLAEAIELADPDAMADAVGAAAEVTPAEARAVVLGCTQYELAMDRIRGMLPRVRLYGSAPAVAAQAIRRMSSRPGPPDAAAGLGGQRQASDATGSPKATGAPSATESSVRPAEQSRWVAFGVAEASAPAGSANPADIQADGRPAADGPRAPDIHVLLSGAPGELPAAAHSYAEGRLLAGLRLPSTAA